MRWTVICSAILVVLSAAAWTVYAGEPDHAELDRELREALAEHDFRGTARAQAVTRLERPLDPELADVGRLLFFDPILSLAAERKSSCAVCHAPNAAFGGTQSIAIGVDGNDLVGPNRTGPRNRRRSPTVVNTALYPRFMLDSRFESLSGDPFDNVGGFRFPEPEGRTLSGLPHLLAAQAFLPVVDRAEMAGEFEGDRPAMRAEIARRVASISEYRRRFERVFPDVRAGAPIAFEHIARALAEFQLGLVFADAPIDRYARGDSDALTPRQKRGAVLFFGEAGCVSCHAVDVPLAAGDEMFTDFRQHVIGVPQIVPDTTNVAFDGDGDNEDFGRERVTGDDRDRYAFRTSPLRNVGLQPFFMHNGAFVSLEDAIRHHLEPARSARTYTPDQLDPDLRRLGPIEPVLARLDPDLRTKVDLSGSQFDDLVAFVRHGLTDPDASPDALRGFIPDQVPSGLPVHAFEW